MVPTIINPTKKFVTVITFQTFFLQKVSVQILARTLAILTELLCGFASQLHDLAALPSGKELSILN